jgi:hypothetical protein
MADKEKYSEERRKNYPSSTRVAEMADAAVEDMLDFPQSTARGMGRYGLATAAYVPAIGVDVARRVKNKVMGTKEQNEEATDRMRKMDEKNPDSSQAKINKILGMKTGGKVSSASKRADGCAIRGKTRA